jgi:3-dehydroquinate dehydratase II
MKQITIINGPNLNLLGKREPLIYGHEGFDGFFEQLVSAYPDISLHYTQTNHEGDIIDILHKVGFMHDGIILNAGGYSHTSIAIMDAISAIKAPVIDVHISNIYEREPYRHNNYIAKTAVHSIVGQGLDGYTQAIDYLVNQCIK